MDDLTKPPVGYRYDNGKSQYVYLDLAGNPTGKVENRGSGIGSQLLDMGKTLAPLGLAAIGANFLAPALSDLFGSAATDLFGGGAAEELTGAGGAGTSINEMIASGTAPGSVGAAGAAAGALTPAELAAASGIGLGLPAVTNLTPAAIESLSGTAGYGTNASALQAAIDAGINPAIVGSGAGLTAADLLAGTTAAGTIPATTSLNEMVASGLGPGSAGAYGAAAGALTPEALAAAAGTVGAGSLLSNLVGAGGVAANLAAGTPAATSLNEMVASGLGPGAAGAAGAAAGKLTGDALSAAAGTGAGSSLLSSLTDTLVQKAKDAISSGSSAATDLVKQLQDATGLTGTQLATLLSGAVGAGNAANLTSAINTGLDATTAANTASQGVLKDIYNQQLGFQAPYQATGISGLNQINKLADTGYLTHQFNAADLAAGLAPNYDFMLQQGQMANQRAANVGGGALSGNTLQGLQRYTQDYAGNAYQNAFNNYQGQRNNIYNNLANMAGIGQTANAGAQAAGTAYSKGTTDLNTALANAQAAAAIGKAQAASQGTTGLANSTFLASLLAPPK